ncbi:MAG: alpha-ketoglutarate-dependent dioxygenase AlkB [Cyanobacteria bacterium P01_F01_bin.150]
MAQKMAPKTEALISKANNILILLSKIEDMSLVKDFCGAIHIVNDVSSNLPSFFAKTVYLGGDISKVSGLESELKTAERVLVVRELAYGYDKQDDSSAWPIVDIGQVPILVHGAGVYYRRFFNSEHDYFNQIRSEHVFQSLTESTKPVKAHRTGIYLTPVEWDGETLHFHLLRCSTNLSGPTENFGANDRHIVAALNQEADRIFQNHAPLNHVLAQIYHNTPATEVQKQTKAKIKAHADKTKDMPENGIMAFCTFYEQLDKLKPLAKDTFDYGYKKKSGLTKLDFRLKASVAEHPECDLPAQFTVTLYPHSVFFMPLSTNRLYTHAIRSSVLDASMLPTRLGYVVRCSATEAVYKNGQTFLKLNDKLIKLEPPTLDGIDELRKLYAEENKTDAFIDYGNKFLFSMNKGDYTAPMYQVADEFRCYTMPIEGNIFEDLRASVRFEEVGKGRQGTVLVNPDETRGIPIVRTTAQYNAPAQCFQSVHRHLAQQIQKTASLPFDLNNALIEIYTNAYTKMGFHSDQALDLEDQSFIAIFSCYQYPELATPPRKLIVKAKESEGGNVEIPLIHNSIVVFCLDTNRRFKHKIMLDMSTHPPENQWLGITFRTSKTFVQFSNEQTYFEGGTPLTLATDGQRQAFYKLRCRENKEPSFIYPQITYTISKSDMMPPITQHN